MVDTVGLSPWRSLSLGNPFYGVSFDPWLPVNLTNYVPEGEARNSTGSRCVNSVVAFRLARLARRRSPTRISLPSTRLPLFFPSSSSLSPICTVDAVAWKSGAQDEKKTIALA